MTQTSNAVPPVAALKRRLACRNTRFLVWFDHVVDSRHGAEVEDYLVVAPLHTPPDLVTGISVLPVWEGKVVLLRSWRHAIGRWILEVPRGFRDAGETPETAARRELEEEAGLVCDPPNLVPLGFCAPEASLLAARVALFAALDCRPGGARDEQEIGLGERVLFTLDEARALLAGMTLEDPTTALALHRYFLLSRD